MNNLVVDSFWRRLSVGALVAAYVFAAGCAGMQRTSSQDYAGMSPAEQRLAQQSQAYNDTQLEGCLLGAGAGLVGACTVGRCKLADILIGVAVGAAVGCTAGTYLANVQKGHGTTEEQLNVVINDMRRQNRQLVAYNQTAKTSLPRRRSNWSSCKKTLPPAGSRVKRPNRSWRASRRPSNNCKQPLPAPRNIAMISSRRQA